MRFLCCTVNCKLLTKKPETYSTKGFPSLVFVSQVQIGEIYDASLRERLRERKEDVFGDLTPL